jgi:putative RecB family exonuclease
MRLLSVAYVIEIKTAPRSRPRLPAFQRVVDLANGEQAARYFIYLPPGPSRCAVAYLATSKSTWKEPRVYRQCNQGNGAGGRRQCSADRPHWSYSQVNQFLRCPLSYYFDRVAKLPKPFISSGLALGSTVHHTLAEIHRSIQEGRNLGTEEVHDVLTVAWDEMENREPIQYRDGEDRVKSLDQAVALLDLYLKEPVPECVVAVEEPLLVPLFNSQGEALEKPLLAIPDLITREHGELTVTEFKTSGRRYGEVETDASLQASCYAHAVQDRYDEQPRVRYTVLVKTKTPQIQHLETIRNDADVNRLGDVVQAVDRAIQAGIFYPVESPMNCSGCPFYRACKEWTGCQTPAVVAQKANGKGELVLC